MRQRLYRTRRKPPMRVEQALQCAVVEHLRIRGVPGLVWWHTPNGGARSPTEAAILKGMGVRAGVSDLILIHKGICYALELKAFGGRMSREQAAFMGAMADAGAVVATATGLDDAICRLEDWRLLRGTTLRDFRQAQAEYATAGN